MTFRLGYSTYALSRVDPFIALPKIRETGYEDIEICMGDDWPTAPHRFDNSQRKRLAEMSESLGFPSPIFFGGIDVCADDWAAEREKTLAKFAMAAQLHYDGSPILITTTSGHHALPWDTGRERIAEAFVRLADLAAGHNVIIAVEPHAGTDFETPEKAVWLMENTRHPNLKLDLDVSHFHVEGSDVGHSVDLCAPYAAMVHIKDGSKVDGKVRYCLTGEGTIDVPAFIQSLKKNGLEHLPVFAEISVQQSRLPDYDPWRTAKFCYDALDRGRQAVQADA